jgi:hypothetical protein
LINTFDLDYRMLEDVDRAIDSHSRDPLKRSGVNGVVINVRKHFIIYHIITSLISAFIFFRKVDVFVNHLIFYVTRFSIGWKIGVILCHTKKIYMWCICSNVTEYSSALEYIVQKQIMEHIKFYYIIFMFLV